MTAKFEGALIYDVILQNDAMNIMDGEIETKRAIILRIRKQLQFLKHYNEKRGLEELYTHGA